jgi:hypothetical protein
MMAEWPLGAFDDVIDRRMTSSINGVSWIRHRRFLHTLGTMVIVQVVRGIFCQSEVEMHVLNYCRSHDRLKTRQNRFFVFDFL